VLEEVSGTEALHEAPEVVSFGDLEFTFSPSEMLEHIPRGELDGSSE